MPNKTQTLGLTKPLKTERYNVDVFNENADKIDRLYANTIEDLKLKTGCAVGDVVEVLGYYEKGDGAGHPRQKKPAGYIGADAVVGADGSIWGIVHNGEVNISWFGARKGMDCSRELEKALNEFGKCLITENYKISSLPVITKEGAELYSDSNNILVLGTSIKINKENFKLTNITLKEIVDDTQTSWNPKLVGLDFSGVPSSNTDFWARNCTFVDLKTPILTKGRNNKILNCIFSRNIFSIIINDYDINQDNNRGTVIDGCKFHGVGFGTKTITDKSYCIKIGDNHKDYKITNNKFDGGCKNLMYLPLNSDCYIDNNIGVGFFGNGIDISYSDGSRTWSISGNRFVASRGTNQTYFCDNSIKSDVVLKGGLLNNLILGNSRKSAISLEELQDSTISNTNIREVGYLTKDNGIYINKSKNNIFSNLNFVNQTNQSDSCIFLQTSTNNIITNITKNVLFTSECNRFEVSQSIIRDSGGYNRLKDKDGVLRSVLYSLGGTMAQAPINPPSPFLYYDITSRKLMVWNGSVWIDTMGTNALQQLNTPYYTTKMDQQGILHEYYTYLDSLHAYEKQQKETNSQRQLAFEQRENQEQTYEEWLSQQPMVLPVDNKPEPSENILNFAKEYNLI